MALVDEVAGGQAEPLGEVVERDHRGPGDPRLERAHICFGVALPGELLLGETRAMPRLADAKADALRELTVLVGGSGTGPGPWHGGSLHRAGKPQLTRVRPMVLPVADPIGTDVVIVP